MSERQVNLKYLTYKDLKTIRPNLVVLPWGAVEAHNQHLPYASDVIEAEIIAEESALMARKEGARVVVLPVLPFGNNAQHLYQAVTIHLNTSTSSAILHDILHSLQDQDIDRLLIVNSHGGNDFKPLVRDLQLKFNVLIVLANLFEMVPEMVMELFPEPGDHAGELETSLLLYIWSEHVRLKDAGIGRRRPFTVRGINQKGIWTPRPWQQVHPDSGSGDPANADAEKGQKYFNALCDSLKEVMIGLSQARKGDLPYL